MLSRDRNPNQRGSNSTLQRDVNTVNSNIIVTVDDHAIAKILILKILRNMTIQTQHTIPTIYGNFIDFCKHFTITFMYTCKCIK